MAKSKENIESDFKDWYSQQKKRTTAKAEFLALKSTVETLLNEGYSGKAIHDFLTERGRVKMSYPSFTKYINMFIYNNNKSSKIATEDKPYNDDGKSLEQLLNPKK